jgi:rod shape determining protein RodA
LIAAGITALIFTHVFMNIGMTISVTPITGLPLPFISYGGTFVIVMMVAFGLLQSIWVHRHTTA